MRTLTTAIAEIGEDYLILLIEVKTENQKNETLGTFPDQTNALKNCGVLVISTIKWEADLANRVHIVWDNSNIFVSGRAVCDKLEFKPGGFRINFENLIDLAADDRAIEQVFCVGSVPPPTDSVWGHIEKKTGKKPELYERGAASGKEQAVDQALQTRMLRLGYDYDPPEAIVLLSGDGSGFEEGIGFFSDIKRLHKIGWNVEVLSWKDHCKRVMRDRAEENALFIPLDDFYSSVTFLEKLRWAKSLDLTDRPRRIT